MSSLGMCLATIATVQCFGETCLISDLWFWSETLARVCGAISCICAQSLTYSGFVGEICPYYLASDAGLRPRKNSEVLYSF
jgi:hypothetical protein